jgi:hypothetical protein
MADCNQQIQKDQACCATVLIVGYFSLGENRGLRKWRRRKNKLPGHIKEKNRKMKEIKRKVKNLTEID